MSPPARPSSRARPQICSHDRGSDRQGLRKGQLVVLESTTYPAPRAKSCSRAHRAGQDLRQRLLPRLLPRAEDRQREYHTRTSPRSSAASTSVATDGRRALQRRHRQDRPGRQRGSGRISKLLENIFGRSISPRQRLKVVFDRMASTCGKSSRPRARSRSASCPSIPAPASAATASPRPLLPDRKPPSTGRWARFIELAGEINTGMPRTSSTAPQKPSTSRAIDQGSESPDPGLLQPNIDDDRESPSFELIELLDHRGPWSRTPSVHPKSKRGRKFDWRSSPSPARRRSSQSTTRCCCRPPHHQFKDAALYRDAKLVIDTRKSSRSPSCEHHRRTRVMRASGVVRHPGAALEARTPTRRTPRSSPRPEHQPLRQFAGATEHGEESASLTLRVIVNGARGVATTTAFEPEEIARHRRRRRETARH